ncbi:MAG: hypothetical protein ACRDRT_17700 [Pseudonocardiaceae bacterium]
MRRAEDIFPERVYRHPMVRQTVTGLVKQSRRDAVDRELRGLAYRTDVKV